MQRQRFRWRDYALLTVLVILFSLGKVSLGFSFALVVGLWLFLKKPTEWRTLVVGLGWVAFFVLYQDFFGRELSGPVDGLDEFSTRFSMAWGFISAIILISLALAVLAWTYRVRLVANFAIAAVLAGGFIGGLVALSIDNRSDVFYFFQGLFSVVLLLSIGLAASVLATSPSETLPRDLLVLRFLAFTAVLLFAVSPVSRGTFSPYSSVPQMWAVVSTLSSHTYVWFNEGARPGEGLTVRQALLGKPLPVQGDGSPPYPSQLRDELRGFIDREGLAGHSPLIGIATEDMDALTTKFGSSANLWTSLAVVAVTGFPLVNGVNGTRPDYGFADYGPDSAGIPKAEMAPQVLCVHERPVVLVQDIEEFAFVVVCRPGADF